MSTSDSLISLEVHPSHVVVRIHPDLTNKQWADVEALGQKVVAQLEARDSPTCLVDLVPLTYMGSGAVAFVVRLWKVIKSKNGRMAVVCNNEFVLEVLRLAALDRLWAIVPDHAEAYKQLRIRGVPPQTRPPEVPEREQVPSRRGEAFAILAIAGLILSLGTLLLADRLQLGETVSKTVMFVTGGCSLLFGLIGTVRGRGWLRPASGLAAACAAPLLLATTLAQSVSLDSFANLVRPAPTEAKPVPNEHEESPIGPESADPVAAANDDASGEGNDAPANSGDGPPPPAASTGDPEGESGTTPPSSEATGR